MKFLIFAALVAFASAQSDRPYPVFNQTCVERKAQIRESVKTAFNVAAVSEWNWLHVWEGTNCGIFQYSGTWFEIERYQQRDESEADCMSSQYSWGFISRSFSISRTGHDFANDTGFNRQATALLSFPDISPTIGLLNVTYYADRGFCLIRALIKWKRLIEITFRGQRSELLRYRHWLFSICRRMGLRRYRSRGWGGVARIRLGLVEDSRAARRSRGAR